MPLVVLPTWNKGIEEKLIQPVWSKALQELMTAGRLFIVGYSFPETDQFFKYMLGLALAGNNKLTEIYVVNSSDKVAEKFKQFFNPYFHQRVVQYHPKRTSEFIGGIQNLTKQEFNEAIVANDFKRG